MDIKIINNLPPYIKGISYSVMKFEICLKDSYIYIHFTP